MTEKAIVEPGVVDQYAVHARAIIDGKRPVPKRAVLVEFFEGMDASAVSYGMADDATANEHLAQVLAAVGVLSGVASTLNAQASN